MSRLLLLALLGLTTGCSYHVWSPPARAVPMTGVGALDQAEVRAEVSGSYHGSLAVFDARPSVAGGALDLSLGLGENFDLSVGGQTLYLAGGGDTRHHRGIYAGRVGLRWAPVHWFALSGGFGAGGAATGSFVNPDLGITLGDGNEYVGFFLDLRGGVSVPIDPRTLDLRLAVDEEEHLATPMTTAIVQVTPGMRFTLYSKPDEAELVLRVTPNVTILIDREQSAFWLGGSMALAIGWPKD